MGKKDKDSYETPSTMVIEVKHESIICNSHVEGSQSINNWGDGGTTTDEVYL